ncbi:MAG: sigma-70 family RNA polymerase sigma factor [Planctomycetota bacterium]
MNPWESLVREHLPVVTGVALRVLGDRAAAEDVAQDVFLHLLQNPHALDHAENVRSFLCRSAINRSLDRIREKDRRERREAAVEHSPRDLNPLDAAWHEEVRRSVQALPEPERDAVAARYFRGLTVREAAKEMRVSVGTVCNRLEAGVKRLRKWLGAAAFGLIFAVLDDDAFAVEAVAEASRLVRRGTQPGVGSPDTGVKARKRKVARTATGLAGVAALLLISIWIGQPGQIAGEKRRPPEIAVTHLDGRDRSASPEAPSVVSPGGAAARSVRESARPRGELFRAEGFLVRDGDGFALIEPAVREPRRVAGGTNCFDSYCSPIVHHGARGNLSDSFISDSVAAVRAPFLLERGPLLDTIPAGTLASFASWLEGVSDLSGLPRARLVLRAAWVDKAAGLAEAVEIEEAELLTDDWLTVWREALQANASLARAFEKPPGALRRAEALFAADQLETALEKARDARRHESAVAWRMRRESEIEIASAAAVACLGRNEELPEGPAEPPDPESFAASRAVGLELEPVPAIQQGALALRGGSRVLSVAPGSAADRAGLRAGDVIWRMTPLAGEGRSAPRMVLRSEDVSAFVADVAESGGSGLEFEVVRGMDVMAFALSL